jgi:replicative DNA helicase
MDRLPPNASDAESAIIGCCLSFPQECISECQKIITTEEFFYDFRNREIWDTICKFPIEDCNAVSVTARIRSNGMLEKIGAEYLSECQDKAIGPSFLSTWLDEAVEKYTARKLIGCCSDIISSVLEGSSVARLLDKAERDILAIRPNKADSQSIKELVKEALFKIEQRCEKGDTITGISTHLADLDKQSDGLHDGEMIVVAGFPSTGKTALALNIAVWNALQGSPVLIYSAEMRPVQLAVRSICSEARVNFHKAKYTDAGKFIGPAGRLANAPIHIESASGLTIGQVVASARRLHQKKKIRMVVIDYIQLLSSKGDNREQEISNISKGIKSLALELNCPALALSQLTDDGKLRESRAISQDADTIWKLENDGDWQPLIQPIKLRIEKCRDGMTGMVNLVFVKEFTRFESVTKQSRQEVFDE